MIREVGYGGGRGGAGRGGREKVFRVCWGTGVVGGGEDGVW